MKYDTIKSNQPQRGYDETLDTSPTAMWTKPGKTNLAPRCLGCWNIDTQRASHTTKTRTLHRYICFSFSFPAVRRQSETKQQKGCWQIGTLTLTQCSLMQGLRVTFLLIQTTPPAMTVQYETSKTKDRKVAPSRLSTKRHTNTILAKKKREPVKHATSARDLKRRYVHAAACLMRRQSQRTPLHCDVLSQHSIWECSNSDKGQGRQKNWASEQYCQWNILFVRFPR